MVDDPFAPEADPDFIRQAKDRKTPGNTPQACGCGESRSALTRRGFLSAAGTLSLMPLTASADAFMPCIQDRQKVRRCHHRFCKNFGGGRDYHDRH